MENIQEGSHLFSNCADKVNPAEYTPLPLHCTVTLRLLFGKLVIAYFNESSILKFWKTYIQYVLYST